jgi:hypothetical protein
MNLDCRDCSWVKKEPIGASYDTCTHPKVDKKFASNARIFSCGHKAKYHSHRPPSLLSRKVDKKFASNARIFSCGHKAKYHSHRPPSLLSRMATLLIDKLRKHWKLDATPKETFDFSNYKPEGWKQ